MLASELAANINAKKEKYGEREKYGMNAKLYRPSHQCDYNIKKMQCKMLRVVTWSALIP